VAAIAPGICRNDGLLVKRVDRIGRGLRTASSSGNLAVSGFCTDGLDSEQRFGAYWFPFAYRLGHFQKASCHWKTAKP
jgi:hypothetical protein